MTFVVAACPAKNRGWILPTWLESTRRQTRPPDAQYVLLNDCTDDSSSVIDRSRVDVEVINTGDPGWDRVEPRYSIANIAQLRNSMIDRVLALYPDMTHLWSVDSDVEPEPDCLELLLEADEPLVAAPVRNGDEVYNFMRGGWGLDGARRDGFEKWMVETMATPFPVTITGACVLIAREILDEGIRYEDHPQGEDVGFHLQLDRRRSRKPWVTWPPWVQPLARTRHHMVRGLPALVS